MEDSKIEWCHHTFNPWIGCTRVSPGCEHCYAETLMADRYKRVKWGPRGERKRTSDQYWRQPRRWNERAAADGVRARVFCASLADVLDPHPSILQGWRDDLARTVEATPWLDWLMLTKRPELAEGGFPRSWTSGGLPPNVWLGASVEDRRRRDERLPALLQVPAALRFLSCEPLLEEVDLGLTRAAPLWAGDGPGAAVRASDRLGLHWVIVGGESGPGARRFDPHWAWSLIQQGRAAGVPVFVKQMGAKVHTDHRTRPAGETHYWPMMVRDAKGSDPEEWPERYRVREFPESPAARAA